MTRPIVCASDFGYRNEWVGICHAVMSRVAPASRIVDLSHGVPPLDVLVGALHLVDSLPHVDEDAVDVAIVDPNVGQDRDVALETKSGRLLVGPDNGLLIPVSASLGGVERGFEITAEQIILQPVAPSFQARDVLCPAAAHLAAGMAIEELGPALDPDTVVLLSVPEPVVEPGRVQGEVLDMNRFGNVELNIRREHLAAAGLEGWNTTMSESEKAAFRFQLFLEQSTYAQGAAAEAADSTAGS